MMGAWYDHEPGGCEPSVATHVLVVCAAEHRRHPTKTQFLFFSETAQESCSQKARALSNVFNRTLTGWICRPINVSTSGGTYSLPAAEATSLRVNTQGEVVGRTLVLLGLFLEA